MARFYITTPIYYPSGEPHLGHLYTTLCADALARYHRLAGDAVHFLTGTDEHGIKMVKTAAEKGIEPAELAEQMMTRFASAFEEFEVTNDDFIRTSSDRHKAGAQAVVNKMLDAGDIYLGSYEGWYDEGQEEFVTETEAKANEFKSSISGRPLTRFTEPSYFFRLEKYVPQVIAHIEQNPGFIRPESRRNEVLSKLKQGVSDLSISRRTLTWGVKLPNDPEHVLYVWIDALSNYVTALGYGLEEGSRDQGIEGSREATGSPSSPRSLDASSLDPFRMFWPADVHLIGKEILWFHTVYWPAMLLSIGEPLPRCVYAHGWWTVVNPETGKAEKMSKSLGNFIGIERLREYSQTYSQDAVRWYMLRAAPFGTDLEWSDVEFTRAYAELANVLGNGLNRTLKMVHKYRDGLVPDPTAGTLVDDARLLLDEAAKLPAELAAAYAELELQRAAMLPLNLARQMNAYVDATEPFKLAKNPARSDRLDAVLHHMVQAIFRALVALLPVLPHKAAEGLGQLNIDPAGRTMAELLEAGVPVGHKLGEGTPLFPRVDVPA